MGFVVRIPVAAQLPSWCYLGSSIGRQLGFVPMGLMAETVLLVSVTEFGDLRSQLFLSRACRSLQRVLASSMTLARNYMILTLVGASTSRLAQTLTTGIMRLDTSGIMRFIDRKMVQAVSTEIGLLAPHLKAVACMLYTLHACLAL